MTKNLLTLALSALFISACGGGGSDDGPSEPKPDPKPQPTTKAEGAYVGKLASAAFPQGAVQVVILENDEFWGLYGNPLPTGGIQVYGMVQGQGRSSAGVFTATGRDYFYNGAVGAGSVEARYEAGTRLSGTIKADGQTSTLEVTTAAAAPYDYHTPARLSAISGQWQGTTLQGAPFTLDIGSTGTYSGSSQGCAMSGTVTPRASGKNVFDISMRFGAAPCILPHVSVKGVAVLTPLNNGKTQLIATGIDATHAYGSALFAVR